MLNLLKKLWRDETGFVVTSELILISTIVCLAMVVGLTEVSRAVSNELVDVARAFNRLNQGHRYQSLGWGDDDDGGWTEVSGTPAEAEDGHGW